MAYTTTYPISPNGGIIYTSSPTVFTSSGTFTVPSTATANSTIMIESIGGGGGGSSSSDVSTAVYGFALLSDWQGTSAGSVERSQPGCGSYFLGVYRLGFFSANPAGLAISVVAGAGGNGSIQNAQTWTQSGTQSTSTAYNRTNATAGGSSYCSYGGSNFAVAAGGVVDGSVNSTADQSFSMSGAFADVALITAFGPHAGKAQNKVNYTAISGNVFTSPTISQGISSREDYGTTNVSPLGALNSTTFSEIRTGPGTFGTAAADATSPGQQGQHGVPFIKYGTTGTYTIPRAGNGMQPGGPGGHGHGWAYSLANTSTAYTLTAGQVGGNGGAGRVRIWFQA